MLESQMRARADERIRDCLSSVAAGLPSHLEAIAKRTAQSQPEVTKSLGSDGLKILRKELAESAQQLGSELDDAAEKIKWPEASSEYSKVSTRKIGTALFNFLYGSRVDRLAAVFKRHGFSVGSGSGHSQSSILPQYLYKRSRSRRLQTHLIRSGVPGKPSPQRRLRMIKTRWPRCGMTRAFRRSR